MQIKQLEYLVEISHRKSFNSASEYLYITPQSLSRSITTMENELGFKLFERNSRGVRFTREGELFLKAAKEITERYYEAIDEIEAFKQVDDSCSGRLLVYAHSVFTMSVLPQAITKFSKDHSRINVCLLEGVSSSILNNVVTEDNDNKDVNRMGILTIPQDSAELQSRYKKQSGYRFIPLMKGNYVCCVSKDSELALKRNISLKTICQYPLIRFTNEIGEVSEVQSFFLKQYGNPEIAFSTTSIGSWISAIENNVGVGMVHNIVVSSASLIKNEFDKIAVLPIREATPLEVGLLVPNNTDDYIDLFVDFIIDFFNNLN